VRAVQGRSLPLKGVFGPRKEVNRTETQGDVTVQTSLETTRQGGTR